MFDELDYTKFYHLIGDNLKKIRIEHHDSHEKFAVESDMCRGFISQIESPGLTGVGVSLDTLFKICIVYNIDIREFFVGFEKFIKPNKKD